MTSIRTHNKFILFSKIIFMVEFNFCKVVYIFLLFNIGILIILT